MLPPLPFPFVAVPVAGGAGTGAATVAVSVSVVAVSIAGGAGTGAATVAVSVSVVAVSIAGGAGAGTAAVAVSVVGIPVAGTGRPAAACDRGTPVGGGGRKRAAARIHGDARDTDDAEDGFGSPHRVSVVGGSVFSDIGTGIEITGTPDGRPASSSIPLPLASRDAVRRRVHIERNLADRCRDAQHAIRSADEPARLAGPGQSRRPQRNRSRHGAEAALRNVQGRDARGTRSTVFDGTQGPAPGELKSRLYVCACACTLTGENEGGLTRLEVGDLDAAAFDLHASPSTLQRDAETRPLHDGGEIGCFDFEVLDVSLLHVEQDRAGPLNQRRHARPACRRKRNRRVRRNENAF
ncbi:hypothetical protein GCM10007887_40890 [Methylobacterium haplocladii]|nr:hypothetical protein GCM10007887_40890 [Methylobacterium haplocladii]